MQTCEGIIKTEISLAGEMGLSLKTNTCCVGNLRLSLVMKVLEKSDQLENVSFTKLASDFYDKALTEKNDQQYCQEPMEV